MESDTIHYFVDALIVISVIFVVSLLIFTLLTAPNLHAFDACKLKFGDNAVPDYHLFVVFENKTDCYSSTFVSQYIDANNVYHIRSNRTYLGTIYLGD